MLDIIFFAFLLVLCIIDVRVKREYEFDINSSNSLKAVCAFLIFFHHLSQRINYLGVLKNCGYLGVAAFLFLSGYGLTRSYLKTGRSYSKIILYKKIPKLLVMCLVAVLMSTFFVIVFQQDLQISDLLYVFKGNRLLNWYFTECIVLYLATAFVISISNNKNNFIFYITIANFLIFLIQALLFMSKMIGVWWLYSFWSFELGIVLSIYNPLRVKNRKRGGLLTIIFVVLFCTIWYKDRFIPNVRIKGMLPLACLSAVLFSFLAFLLFSNMKSNCLLNRIGVLSAEILFAQSISLELFHSNVLYIENVCIYSVASILLEIVLVFIYKKINDTATKVIANVHLN